MKKGDFSVSNERINSFLPASRVAQLSFRYFPIVILFILLAAFFLSSTVPAEESNFSNLTTSNVTDNLTEIYLMNNSLVIYSNKTLLTPEEDNNIYIESSENQTVSSTPDLGTEAEINSNIETGLVMLWHFNNDSAYGENDTHIYDFTGNGYNITSTANITNTTVISAGKIGGAYFYNSTSYLSAGRIAAVENLSSMSISLWAKFEVANTDTQYIISKKRSGFRGWEVYRSSDERFSFKI